jgi:hypothetical protein
MLISASFALGRGNFVHYGVVMDVCHAGVCLRVCGCGGGCVLLCSAAPESKQRTWVVCVSSV